MLTRLMTVYFLQPGGLLDGDRGYLFHRLRWTQEQLGEDNFYGCFLLALFHQRLGQTSVVQGAVEFGEVPALDLPLFRPHRLEREYDMICIGDAAFAELFGFFDEYRWRLEEGDDALHPGILADIFEQHINQKQMGAYYTEEDITSYIACNTIVPYFLGAVGERCPSFFGPGAGVWKLLQTCPERYIQESLQCSDRLPMETEREYAQRRARYGYVYRQLSAGAIERGEDLITYNLDMLRFSLDAIGSCEQFEVVLACYRCIEDMTVLDPTCGSGAFLFAALHVLRVLYTACLERLEALGKMGHHDDNCRALLGRLDSYAQREHFILSTIFSNNLYGVDLMEEATDMCKLRLFLTLLAYVEDGQEIAPLSAIHFNIHAGNALVGFVHAVEIDELDTDTSEKQDGALDQQLARRYGIKREEFADDSGYMKDVQAWRGSHQPFHWCQAFRKVMERGGFDVIIGNPPYVEYSKVRQSYTLVDYGQASCGNLYAAVIERSLVLCRPSRSYVGLIVPLSLCGSERFGALRASLSRQTTALWLANFEIFPCRLFADAYQRQSILIAKHDSKEHCALHVTKIQRWYAAERCHLIQQISYTTSTRNVKPGVFPKLASPLQESILYKVRRKAGGECIANALSTRRTDYFVYYQEATNYWMKATCHVPFYKKNGVVMEPSHGRFLYFHDELTAYCIMALMNSSLFYIWFSTYSDGFHLAHALVQDFPTGNELYMLNMLPVLAQQLRDDIRLHTRMSTRNTHNGKSNGQAKTPGLEIELEEYQMSCSKLLLDKIDVVLAEYYGFTDEELDFIINYDCKYRMGIGAKDGAI
jgi:hypothetical protein